MFKQKISFTRFITYFLELETFLQLSSFIFWNRVKLMLLKTFAKVSWIGLLFVILTYIKKIGFIWFKNIGYYIKISNIYFL